MPQLENGVRHGFLSIKDPYLLHAVWGAAKTPGRVGGFGLVPLDLKGVEFGFLASFLSPPPLNKKKLIKKEYCRLSVSTHPLQVTPIDS